MPGGNRTPASNPRSLAASIRRGKAIQMRLDGMAVPDIKNALGYRQVSHVYQDIGRALAQYVGEPAAELRALEVARMDAALLRLVEREQRVLDVRDRIHITVNNGRVITVADEDGKEVPLIDDEPVLRANAQLMAIEKLRGDVQTRRSKLLGLDAPTKVSVITDEALDEELAATAAAVADLERAAAAEDDGAEEAPEPAG